VVTDPQGTEEVEGGIEAELVRQMLIDTIFLGITSCSCHVKLECRPNSLEIVQCCINPPAGCWQSFVVLQDVLSISGKWQPFTQALYVSHVLPEAPLYQNYSVFEAQHSPAVKESTRTDLHPCTRFVNTSAACLACIGAVPWNGLPTCQVLMMFVNVLQGSMNSMRALYQLAGSRSACAESLNLAFQPS